MSEVTRLLDAGAAGDRKAAADLLRIPKSEPGKVEWSMRHGTSEGDSDERVDLGIPCQTSRGLGERHRDEAARRHCARPNGKRNGEAVQSCPKPEKHLNHRDTEKTRNPRRIGCSLLSSRCLGVSVVPSLLTLSFHILRRHLLTDAIQQFLAGAHLPRIHRSCRPRIRCRRNRDSRRPERCP